MKRAHIVTAVRLVLVSGVLLTAQACGTSGAPSGNSNATNGSTADAVAVPASMVDSWEQNCGGGKVPMKATVTADGKATLDGTVTVASAPKAVKVEFRLDTNSGIVTGTVTKNEAEPATVGARVTFTAGDKDTLMVKDGARGIGIGQLSLTRTKAATTQTCAP
jgi:hypothetical protein